MAKPLDPLSLAAFEAFKNVLSQKGLVLVREGDTQHGLYGEDGDKVLREAARNAVQDVLLVQSEEALEEDNRRLAALQDELVIGGAS